MTNEDDDDEIFWYFGETFEKHLQIHTRPQNVLTTTKNETTLGTDYLAHSLSSPFGYLFILILKISNCRKFIVENELNNLKVLICLSVDFPCSLYVPVNGLRLQQFDFWISCTAAVIGERHIALFHLLRTFHLHFNLVEMLSRWKFK